MAVAYSIAINKWGKYCVPALSRHRPAAQKILAGDVYEPGTIEFMLDNYSDGDIVHAGTYFGDFLPALSGEIFPNAKIWAFEPNPENYFCAKTTLELNDIENVVLMEAGLGAERKYAYLQTTDKNGRHLGGASRISATGTLAVQIVTLDEIVPVNRDVSIIQLDVEGYEKEALMGALDIIQRCLPILIFEVWSTSSLLDDDWFSSNILNLGYHKVKEVHGNLVFQVRDFQD